MTEQDKLTQQTIKEVKMIAFSVLAEEKAKMRDIDAKGTPFWGPLSRSFGDGITHIETEIDNKIGRLEKGEVIYDILPELIKNDM